MKKREREREWDRVVIQEEHSIEMRKECEPHGVNGEKIGIVCDWMCTYVNAEFIIAILFTKDVRACEELGDKSCCLLSINLHKAQKISLEY